MNLSELLNQVADDADASVLADPVEIRRAGDRRSARTRRRMGTAAVAALVAAGTVLLTRGGGHEVEPAPPVPPDRVSYLDEDGISFVSGDGSRHTLPAKNVDRFALSPDGQTMAYITYDAGTNRLWLADAEAARSDRQPAPCAGCMPGYGLTWSNDGTRLAYSVLTPGTHRPAQLRIRTIGTGRERVYVVPRGCEARGPRFSPDDQSLATNLSCEDGRYKAGQYVATLDLDAGTSSWTRLTHRYGQVQLPSWSADGQTVYFTATTSGDNPNDSSGSGDLFAVGTDGTGLRQVTHAVAGQRFFAASPFGNKFLVNLARGKGPWEVGWLSLDGTTFTPMTGRDGKSVLGTQPQLQP